MATFLLAGGRGRRMGALTSARQKAALFYKGRPLLCHHLSNLLSVEGFDPIYVLTGYRPSDVHYVLTEWFPGQLRSQRIQMLDFPAGQGTLSVVSAAIRQLHIQDLIVSGAEIIVPQYVLRRFRNEIQGQDVSCGLYSPRLEIAPLHPRVQIRSGYVHRFMTHQTAEKHQDESALPGWMTDIGVRYFPSHVIPILAAAGAVSGINSAGYFESVVPSSIPFKAVVFRGPWKHFAQPQDFTL